MSKITVGGTTASPTYTKADTTITDKVVLAFTAPLGIMDNAEDVFYSKKDVAVVSLAGIGAGIVLGDKFGQSIPVLGGRRGL